MVQARTSSWFAGCWVIAACTGAPTQSGTGEKKVEPAKVVEAKAEPVKQAPEVKTEPEAKVEAKTEPAKPGAPRAGEFMFVFRGEVAVASTAEEGWGTGKVRFKKTKEGLEGRRDVDAAKLPAELQALQGAAVTLYGASGKVCEGTLKGFSLYGLSERGDEEERESPDELPSMPKVVRRRRGSVYLQIAHNKCVEQAMAAQGHK